MTSLASEAPATASEGKATGSGSYALRIAVIAALIVVLFLCELMVGAAAIPLGGVADILLTGGAGVSEVWRNIVLEFRLPRAVNALVSGAALGAAGVLLQTLFRNPLADLYVLGVVHGARLGAAVLVVATGLAGNAFLLQFGVVGDLGLALASFFGCGLILGALAGLSRRVSTITLLICGLMLGYFAIGLINALMHLVDENQARAFKAWDDASFAAATWTQLQVLVPAVAIGVAVIVGLAKNLDALLLGEAYASSMGAPVRRLKLLSLGVTAWLCGVVTAFCGPVAFVGLIAAQVARGVFRSSPTHLRLIPAAALLGGAVALAADLVTHLPARHHIFHLNAVIGLVGAPLALWVLVRGRALRAFEG